MVRTRRLARNALWTLFGQAAPMLTGVAAVPPLIGAVGTERFGIVTLFWLTVGYFSLFDLGLGRATTQLVAARLGRGDEESLGSLIWTALAAICVLGMLGGATLAAVSPYLVRSVLKVPTGHVLEATNAFRLLALAIPAVTLSTGLRGVLEAREWFRTVGVVRCVMGLMTFLGPLVAVWASPRLESIALVLVVTRWLTALALVPMCVAALPALGRARLALAEIPALFTFGGWITVTNIISPVMVNIDRFLIGSLLSIAAVGYYATPFEVVTKINIIPGALVAVLFPAFAAAAGAGAAGQAYALLERGMRLVLVVTFPIALAVVFFAKALLTLWLGAEFAAHGADVTRILAIGVLCNGVAYVPSAFVQASGRPDLAAKLHLIELPVYLLLLWVLARTLGLPGIAIAWTLRVGLDLLLLCFASRVAIRGDFRWRPLAGAMLGTTSALVACTISRSLLPRIAATGYALAALVALTTYVIAQENSGRSRPLKYAEPGADSEHA